ncbi:hypothetical protein LLE75_00280 [Staphylococcus epidermidis]|nr:hypothetical protein [Staphylococcus epidermidis]
MTLLGQLITDMVEKQNFENKVKILSEMPEWEFITVMGYGFFDEICAGTTHKGVCYTEQEIYAAYWKRNPDAEPLL